MSKRNCKDCIPEICKCNILNVPCVVFPSDEDYNIEKKRNRTITPYQCKEYMRKKKYNANRQLTKKEN